MVSRERNSADFPKPKEDIYILWVKGISQQYRWQEFKDRVRECRPRPDKISVRQSAVHEPIPGCGQVTIPNKEQALFAYEHLCTHGWNRQIIEISLFGVRGGEVERPKLLRGPKWCGPDTRSVNSNAPSTPGRAAIAAISPVSPANARGVVRPSFSNIETPVYPTQIAYTTAGPMISTIEAPVYPLGTPTSTATYSSLLSSPTSTTYSVQYPPQYPIAPFSQPAPVISPPQEPRLSRTVFLSNIPKGATFQSVKDYVRFCIRNAGSTVHIEGVDMHGLRGHVSVVVGNREQGELVVRHVAGKRWGGRVVQARFERDRPGRRKAIDENVTANTGDSGRTTIGDTPESERTEGIPLIIDGSRGAGSIDQENDNDEDEEEEHNKDPKVADFQKDVDAVTRVMSKTTISRKGRR